MKGSNMTLSFGIETIFEDASFQIQELDKVGIVGVNGAGKTTLFRILLKQQELDSGSIFIGKANIGYLPQEIKITNENMTGWEYLQTGRPIQKLETELHQIYQTLTYCDLSKQEKLLHRMAKIQTRLDYFDYYQAESILLDIIEHMHVDVDILDLPLKDLSGGQKSTIAFVRLLYAKSDILLLDEPTNNLDIHTKSFVTRYLKKYKGMVLIISHDIDFLNQIINKVLFINKVTHKITIYHGDYTAYKKKYTEEQQARNRFITQQEKEIKKLETFVQRAHQASRTNHAIKRMGQERSLRLEKQRQKLQTRETTYQRVKMDIKPQKESPSIPLEVKNISFHYPHYSYLYKDLSFTVHKKERFLIVGKNGIGKSTLLKLLMGILPLTTGNIHYHQNTDIAYYAQELEQLQLQKTILENVDTIGYTTRQLRSILSNFLFYEEDINKKVSVLSPGEKARLALCKVLLQKANLILLDEPTNHLDPETQAIIGGNFHLFEGTIIVVSHNISFIEQIGINRMLLLPEGKIELYSPTVLKKYMTTM